MFPNYFGLGCAVLALAAFIKAHRQALEMSRVVRWRWFLLTGALALPAGYNALYYLHWFPEAVWFYEVRSWPGVEILVIPVGAAGGVWASLIHRRLLVLPLLATAGVAWGPFLKPVFSPVDTARLHDTWTHEVCIQSTLSSCGPASTATVLRALRVEAKESDIMRAAHTYAGGTEAWYLARYIRSRGLKAQFGMHGRGFDPAMPLPAIVGVRLASRGHFIAVTARNGDVFDVGDPMAGPEKLTRAQLERRYEFTGFVLTVSR